MPNDGRQKVLIIKPGYSETLDPEMSGMVSLGDILRTTPILHLFPQSAYHVSWLVDETGWPVLRGNRMIDRVIKINAFTPFHLMREHFDVVVNLEKDPGLCALADMIPAWRRFGFRLDPQTGSTAAYEHSLDALHAAADPQVKRRAGRAWIDWLFEMLGSRYNGEPIVLGHRPAEGPTHDIGFNYRVGKKFPLKAWPREYWDQLEAMLKPDFSITWQPGADDLDHLERYIDWVGSCRLLVTNDSLGMHIAAAQNIPVVGLFGPTSPLDVTDQPGLVKLWAEHARDCIRCDSASCAKDMPCMPTVLPETVEQAVRRLMPPRAS